MSKGKKKKILSKEERQEKFCSGEKLEWFSDFPFEALNGPSPETTIAVACHWDKPTSMMTTGTAYLLRFGNSRAPIKVDGYSFRPEKDGSGVILEIKKPHLPYHYIKNIDEIPPVLKDGMPHEILLKIQEAL